MRSFAENIQHIAHAIANRVNQVVAFFSAVGLVADVVECIDHKVNWHDVDAPTFQAD